MFVPLIFLILFAKTRKIALIFLYYILQFQSNPLLIMMIIDNPLLGIDYPYDVDQLIQHANNFIWIVPITNDYVILKKSVPNNF